MAYMTAMGNKGINSMSVNEVMGSQLVEEQLNLLGCEEVAYAQAENLEDVLCLAAMQNTFTAEEQAEVANNVASINY